MLKMTSETLTSRICKGFCCSVVHLCGDVCALVFLPGSQNSVTIESRSRELVDLMTHIEVSGKNYMHPTHFALNNKVSFLKDL